MVYSESKNREQKPDKIKQNGRKTQQVADKDRLINRKDSMQTTLRDSRDMATHKFITIEKTARREVSTNLKSYSANTDRE